MHVWSVHDRPEPRPERRTRSGPNIPEKQRGTVSLHLRVAPETERAFRALARRWKLPLSETLAELVRRGGVGRDDDDG